MNDDQSLDELEASLRQLRFSPATISQQQIWYQAGLAAGRRRVFVWQSASALVAGLLVATIAWHSLPKPVELTRRIVRAPETVPLRTSQPAVVPPSVPILQTALDPTATYLQLREALSSPESTAMPRPTMSGRGELRRPHADWPLAPGYSESLFVRPIPPNERG